MSKQITGAELAEVVTKLLANPDATVGQGDGKAYESLMTEIARAVCNHSGGEVLSEASFLDDVCYVGIAGDEWLPPDGGVWKDYDLEGEL